MSTPAIRAILFPLALTLLVARVLTDHTDVTGPADHLALLTNGLDARADLHYRTFSFEPELFVAVGDASTGHVVGRDLYLDLVAGQDADAVHAHLAGTVGENGVAVLELHAKHGVRQWLDDGSLDGERVFLGLAQVLSPC
jgi:hypothetical protein